MKDDYSMPNITLEGEMMKALADGNEIRFVLNGAYIVIQLVYTDSKIKLKCDKEITKKDYSNRLYLAGTVHNLNNDLETEKEKY